VFTIGHSNRPLQEFLALLRQVEVSMLVAHQLLIHCGPHAPVSG
jgi:hypothetical protein